MADQRPAFRFRLPWQSAAPPPRPTFPRRPSSQPTATPTPTTAQTAATPARTQPSISTTPTIPATPQTATAPAPARPTITTTPTTPTAPQTAATQAPPQPTIATTPTTTPTAPQTAATQAPPQPTIIMTPTTTPTAPQTAATQAPSQPTIATTPTTTPTAPQTAATQAPPQPTIIMTPTTTPTAPQTAATQAPSQPTITTTPTPTTPQTAETQVPVQPSSITTPAPTPQTAERVATTQPTITTSISPTTVPQRAETQIPTQPPAATTSPIPTAERPPFRPPGIAPAQAPLPQSQTSRTESQPSSPSRAATQSQASSQPSTQPRTVPQSRAVSLPSSPSRRSPQLPSTPQIATQPRSTTIVASRPAGQALSSRSPSSTTAQPQPTTEAVNQPTSPSKREQSLNRDSSQPSANSTEVSSLTDKQEPKSAVPETPSLELQLKPATISGMDNDSPDRAPKETGIQPNQMIRGQPSKESRMGAAKVLTTAEGQETPAVTQISHNSTNNGNHELFPKEFKSEETKEVKEVVQENKGKAHNGARHKEADFTGELGQTIQTKDLPSIAFQSEQTQKHIDRKEITATSASNGKQTKITTPQPRNKTMVVDTHQKLATSDGEHIPLHKEVRDDISKLVNKMAIGDSKHSIDDKPVSVITLAGENRGASMQVGVDSSRKEGAVHIRRGYKIKADDTAEATTDGEESIKEKSNNPKTKEDQASEAYVNSNVQGVNNSIMFNSSITERNPGVHLIHSHFPTEPKKPSEKPGLAETKKAEFNTTPSQKLTHEPTVRRRCLRGLFLESSDSDADGTKSRRHGCRVGCNEKSKENNIDVL